MMKNLVLILFLLLFAAPVFAQEVETLSFEDLEQRYLFPEGDTLYVLNFWATWCKPCVDELPYFEKVGEEMADEKVRIVLVSLDFPDQIESRLEPFIEKHGLQNKVVFLDAPRENEWIPKVSEEWSGSIPATLFVNPRTQEHSFFEGAFTYEELKEKINKELK